MDRIECQWCKAQNEPERTSCSTCGAPLDKKNMVSDSGWAEAPRLRDMTEFRFSNSTCQIEGEIVPVAELALSQGDSVFFEHHVMLWKEPERPAVGAEHPRRRPPDGRRHAAHPQRRARAWPDRAVQGRHRRGRGAADPPVARDRRARARVPGRHALAELLVRPHQGPGQRAARRQRHVHGPLRDRQATRACCCCTATATCSRRRCSRARRSWSSRAASCTRTRRCR